jgi:uncharacterized delta-60 repeat protein
MKAWIKSRLIFCAALFCVAPLTSAAPGDFDTTFGVGGRGFADVVGADSAQAHAVAIQPDGKIVAVGKCAVLSTLSLQMCAIRATPNGFFDMSFGTNGTKLINVGSSGAIEIANAVAIQPDGKIVLAGACGPETAPTAICLTRLQSDGALDPGFGLSGKARIVFSGIGAQEARAIALLPSGKILLGGRCAGTLTNEVGACVVRLNANGSLDTSFATGGRTAVSYGANERVTDLVVRPNGRILVASDDFNVIPLGGSYYKALLTQFDELGALDAGFAGTGSIDLPLQYPNRPIPRLALQPDGYAIVTVVGRGFQEGVRMEPQGAIDTTYNFVPGPLGFSIIDGGTFGLKPVLQPNGGTIFVATTTPGGGVGGTADFSLLRLTDTATLDPLFARGAKPMLAAADIANDAALQSDGKLVVVGACDAGTKIQMCLARFEAATGASRSCTMDIDGDGKVLATTDALLLARVSLGFSGLQVLNGLSISGTRNTWPLIRDYLVSQCGMTTVAP